MIDPLLSLAFAVANNPGVYALLLGSGASRAAAIPTGWEVVADLARKLAAAMGETAEADPSAWYRSKFNVEPSYSDLLDKLARTPDERASLLRQYFEASEEERSRGLKVPTKAHRAIASLVSSGHVKVILTTNFDRLIETALTAAGVVPTVISTSDAVEGALPLIHSRCTVLKLHGDYLDSRVKNTVEELSSYDPRMSGLLDRILDEFGLIVCGWSADWDHALYAAIERTPNRRFTTFWAARGPLTEHARRLVELRRANAISIASADEFFSELSTKITAIVTYNTPHPLSVATAVATLKRYIAKPEHRISQHDLITRETERCRAELVSNQYPVSGVNIDENLVTYRLAQYEAATAILRRVLAYGVYWGGEDFDELVIRSIIRVASTAKPASGLTLLLRLRRYPASLLFCASGLAAIARGKYEVLRRLFEAEIVADDGNKVPAVLATFPGAAIPHDLLKLVPSRANMKTPASEHMFDTLRDDFRELLPDDEEYAAVFDRLEYLISLVNVDLRDKRGLHFWAPTGRFGWRAMWGGASSLLDVIGKEMTDAGKNWPPLKAGLFGGNQQRLEEVKTAYHDGVLGKLHWY